MSERFGERAEKSSLVDSLRDIAAEISNIVKNRGAEESALKAA